MTTRRTATPWAGYCAVQASRWPRRAGGSEALNLARTDPDLMILDVNLPDLNGFEVCRRIKSDPTTALVSVLHLSARWVGSEHRVKGLEGGADGYLVQPVEPQELIATVNALLRARWAEEDARADACEWQATFDSIGDAVCLIGADGIIRRCNRALASLLNAPPEAVEGALYEIAMPAALREPAEPLLARARACAEPQVREAVVGERWLRVTADPVGNEGGSVTGVVQILTDITDLKQLEASARQRAEELDRSARAKDEFIAMLGHELRNPLGAMSNALHVLNQVGSQEAPALRQRAVLMRQLSQLTRLVGDLLDVSRISRAKIELQRQALDLRQVVQHAVQTSSPLIEAGEHQLEVHLPPEPVPVFGDATRLEQVLSILLNNAAKYTDPRGTISVTLDGTPREAVVRVRDTGIGIAPEMLPRVFDMFAEADEMADRTRGGLGLGLTLVRSLVEMHDGQVEAYSPGPGLGSEFIVRLPLTDADPVAAPDPDVSAQSPRSLCRSRRIVVVEDQADLRETM